MFRVVLPPIIRRTYDCIYSIWYLSHRYCYLPLSWKSWNRFECTVCGVSVNVEQNVTINCVTLHLVEYILEYTYNARTHKR
jgi:hypothetical protein